MSRTTRPRKVFKRLISRRARRICAHMGIGSPGAGLACQGADSYSAECLFGGKPYQDLAGACQPGFNNVFYAVLAILDH
jgi:hypothetical protein